MDTEILLAETDPILSCGESAEWERNLLVDEDAAWEAMQSVGRKLGQAILFEYGFSKLKREGLAVLALVGKGHNGGDALLGLIQMNALKSLGRVVIVFSAPERMLKPHTRRALGMLREGMDDDLLGEWFPGEGEGDSFAKRIEPDCCKERFDVLLDGLCGMQFRPPLRALEACLIGLVNNKVGAQFRVAVDVPSGIGDDVDPGAFVADATFATGVCKQGLLMAEALRFRGSLRYLDIGFFSGKSVEECRKRIVKDGILRPLRETRPVSGEKRQYGHLLIVAGSESMPGALAMCVAAALRSGVGLVTVCGPETRLAELSARYPEAMWVGCPVAPGGGLALESLYLIRRYMERATALVVGPGMGRERETLDLIRALVKYWSGPILLDADALQESVIETLSENDPSRAVLSPHQGEWKRITGSPGFENALSWTSERGAIVITKGMNTRLYARGSEYVNTTGNAVLSRGGSGDILSGVVGGLLAQGSFSPEEGAAIGVYWHGKAADLLAYNCGQTAVRTTQLIEYLPVALNEGEAWTQV